MSEFWTNDIESLITTNILVLIVILFIIILLTVIGLLSFQTTRKPVLIVSFVVITVLIVGILAFIFLSPKPDPQASDFILTLYNLDTSLAEVSISLPDGTAFTLVPGQNQTGISVAAVSTIKANGYRLDSSGNKITYDLDYIFNNLTETELYYTCGGVQTNNSYISSLDVDNQSPSPVTLYTQDMKGNIYMYEVVSVNDSIISAYISQFFSTTSDGSGGIVIPNITTVGLVIGTSGVLSITDIPSAKLIFQNSTSQAGWLQYQNPWQSSTSWTTYDQIASKGQSTDVLAYLGQWWRIISQSSSSPITDVYIISQNDLTSGNPIVLSS